MNPDTAPDHNGRERALYALDDIVAAHRYVDNGRKRGNVVVTVP